MNALREDLSALGFSFDAASGCYWRGGMAFIEERRWARFQLTPAAGLASDRLSDHRGQPGLWRWVEDGADLHRVFEMRHEWLSPSGDGEDLAEESEGARLAAFLEWASATAGGSVPEGWQPPAQELVDGWFTKALLTVQTGHCLRQGEWIRESGRLALRFPIHPRVPETLPESRREWLRAVLLDAQDQHYLVRLESDGVAVSAVVDLSGAPHFLLPTLTLSALTGLRATVSALAETVELLTDADVASVALATPPPTVSPQLKGTTA